MLTTTTNKADHQIAVHPNKAATVPGDMKVGETVSFSSTAGEVEIDFADGWPFEGEKHSIHSSEVLTIKERGDYKFTCRIKQPGEPVYGQPYYGAEMKPR